MKLKTVIADDEPLALQRLRFLLVPDADVEIVGECRNARDVIAMLKRGGVDLLFLDIQMPGSNGFEVFEQIDPEYIPVTVFVTAHNNYAVKAFEVHALDYLVKPVEPERLQAALSRVRERLSSRKALSMQEKLKSVLADIESRGAEQEYPKRLLVHNGTKDVFVGVNEIEWIEAADYYSCLHVGNRNFLLRETIKQLAITLDPRKFVRVHRSTIVNIDHVREILHEGRSEGSILLGNGQRLRMSKAGWHSLLAVSRRQ